jgi:hypothetical protein
MKSFLVVALLVSANAFQAPLPQTNAATALSMASTKKKQGNPMAEFLRRITNNFEPIHGHGSLENDLEEQWEAQQEILRKRRSNHLDKDHLKAKYADPSKVKFDGKVGDSSTSSFGKDLSP